MTRLSNVSQPGVTSDQIRRGQVPTIVGLIDKPSDTVRVTVDAGSNDIINLSSCDHPSEPACPVGANLRAILQALNDALARDPGDETIQINGVLQLGDRKTARACKQNPAAWR